jgi:FkbM family methyltransferase
MISYAQNHEDVILQRALGDEVGFYVDVGAASSSIASVTRYFYDIGWSGINIEPLPEYAAELRRERPRDRNIEAAAGASPGLCTFHVVHGNHDFSTFDDVRVSDLAQQGEETTPLEVEVVTLNDVLRDEAPAAIDFLKIDVEGAERDVLAGLDLSVWRPRVLVVEATYPNSRSPSFAGWEDLIVGSGYQYASTDGINRYYVPDEESGLAQHLDPANALDSFIPESVRLRDVEIEKLRAYVVHLEKEVSDKNGYIDDLEGRIHQILTE